MNPPTFTRSDRRWLLRQALLMLLLAILLLLAFENSSLDLALAAWFFDPATGSFPRQHHWLYSNVMHHGLKSAAYAMGFLTVSWCGWSLLASRRNASAPPAGLPPRAALLAGLGVLLIPLLTSGLKHLTNRHCPWDIIDFGGYAPYVHLFADTPADLTRGVCFPAGHASAGFVWMIWALAWRATRPQAARWAFWGGLAAGALMGYGRMAQGAHFLSHVLWSAWLAWALGLLLAALLRVPLTPASSGYPAGARLTASAA